ncbi:hypothetical protein LguiB_024347 [Lonicera macranthoides]
MKKAAWRLTSIGDLRGLASNFNQWWNMIVANLKMEELAVAAMMLNQLIWQGKSLSEMVVVCQALCLLAQWQSAKLGINGARNLGENEGAPAGGSVSQAAWPVFNLTRQKTCPLMFL